MSRAFDTIDRAKLVRILRDEVQLEEDEMRICQSLLADTSLRIKLGEALSDPFASTIGTPQGDGLSPILFAIYLESALRQVRPAAGPRPAEDHGLPLEAIYADDTDFISMSLSYLKQLESLIPPILAESNLFANATKWEWTALVPLSSLGDGLGWKKTKKLGSLLGDSEDIERRKVLATASLKSLRSLWERKGVTSIGTRMRAYNALVLPVLLYNCGIWGVTDAIMNKIEVFHRKQLREVLGVRTRNIRNVELYKRCSTTPLRSRILVARWSLFGHILRLSRDTPAQLAMDYYSQLKEDEKGVLGRPITTLPVVLFNEYRSYKEEVKRLNREQGIRGRGMGGKTNIAMLGELRQLAGDRGKWRDIISAVLKLDSFDCD